MKQNLCPLCQQPFSELELNWAYTCANHPTKVYNYVHAKYLWLLFDPWQQHRLLCAGSPQTRASNNTFEIQLFHRSNIYNDTKLASFFSLMDYNLIISQCHKILKMKAFL